MAWTKNHTANSNTENIEVSVNELAKLGGRKLVYIRAVTADDVIDDLVNEDGELEVDIEENAVLYSVHSGDGERIALVGDRELAFAAARQHEMNPVSVH
ncbi:MAG: DUF1150 family protein [Marinicaulis sp.]|nr:DUF1150 domain-containing protein [Marinicaulis sp.]NNE39326.1 DUF1150 family protein [Marinicaulis sp.]NNL87439.1 DUF1150 family protein [Marinicaulis sp.]